MPNIKSAKKRVIVNAKKNEINKSEKSEVRSAIKNFNALIDAGKLEEAEAQIPAIYQIIDRAVTKGFYVKNTAANKKSGLIVKLNKAKAAK